VVEQQIVDAEVEEADGRKEVERVVEFGYVEFQMQAEVLAEAEVHAETAVFFCSSLLKLEVVMTL